MPTRAVQLPDHAVSDEAAAYIADALMEVGGLELQGEFSQIRCHHQSLAQNCQRGDDDPVQLDLFGRHPPF
jgi:hypothetical protein